MAKQATALKQAAPPTATPTSSARHDLAELRQDTRAAERRVAAARAPIARLEAEIAAGEAARAEALLAERRYARRMADWAEAGQGAAPAPEPSERHPDAAGQSPIIAKAAAAQTALSAARRRLEAAEHDLAVLRSDLAPVIARILRQEGAALAAEYWRRVAAVEQLRRDLAALDQLLATDFPTLHAPTGRPILRHLSPEKLSAPEAMAALQAACADIPAVEEFLAGWRKVETELKAC